jgi:hypothetical protein
MTKAKVAKMSRPAQTIKDNIMRTRRQKKCGSSRTHKPPTELKYVNWHIASIWDHILEATRQAGWQMNVGEIVREVQKIDAELFAPLSRSTVWDWIDYSDEQPK